jgi:hypothetical protein
VEGPILRSEIRSGAVPEDEREPVRYHAVINQDPISVELVVGDDEQSMSALRPLMGRRVVISIETLDDAAAAGPEPTPPPAGLRKRPTAR